MNGFHPRAFNAPAAVAGGSMETGAPAKLVIHTIEAPPETHYQYNPGSYFGHQSWPHCTIDTQGIHQHFPIDVAARALFNGPGGVETNRAHAIQCEVMGRAASVHELPDSTIGHLADWLEWCAQRTGAPLTFARFIAHPASFGEAASQRFSGGEWLAFSGICGHQHVPENDHGDPGDLPVDRIRAMFTQEDDMSPELATQLQKLLAVSNATNSAMERVEISVRDETGGLGVQIEALRREVAALRG